MDRNSIFMHVQVNCVEFTGRIMAEDLMDLMDLVDIVTYVMALGDCIHNWFDYKCLIRA